MLRRQINAGDYGGLGAAKSACRMEHRPFTHRTEPPCKSPNNQQQLLWLRQSSPGINKPPNSTHSGAATCRPVDCSGSRMPRGTQPRCQGTASFPRDQQLLSGLWQRLTVDDHSVAQIPVQALRPVAHG